LGDTIAKNLDQSGGVETVRREIGQRCPEKASLLRIRASPTAGNCVVVDLTLEHELDPVNTIVIIVVLADELTEKAQFTNLNRDTNLLQTLALNGFAQRLAMLLPAPRQDAPLVTGVTDPNEQDAAIPDYDRFGGIAYEGIAVAHGTAQSISDFKTPGEFGLCQFKFRPFSLKAQFFAFQFAFEFIVFLFHFRLELLVAVFERGARLLHFAFLQPYVDLSFSCSLLLLGHDLSTTVTAYTLVFTAVVLNVMSRSVSAQVSSHGTNLVFTKPASQPSENFGLMICVSRKPRFWVPFGPLCPT
jgi:hypothetical protein